MADSTTNLDQLLPGQEGKEVKVNEFLDAASAASAYGRRASTCVGRTWGYYGTRYGGDVIANGTHLCDASDTTYMLVDASTGEPFFSTDPLDWDDDAYGRAYLITTGPSSVTSYEDHRFGPRGIFSIGGSGIGVDVQAWNQALDEISGLTPSNDDLLQRKAGAWTNRTVAQVTADLHSTGLVGAAVGFRDIPQNSQSTAYTTVAADSGKHLFHPSADTTARTFTIDSNTNVAYPIGTAITFINQNGAGVITIAITSDTLRLAGSGSTGSRSLAANGVATAIKVTSTEWIISGTGLT